MSKHHLIVSQSVLASLFVCAFITAPIAAGDLSKYRGFEFGTALPAVAKQVGVSVSEAKIIHNRPALIQELKWRPRSLGPGTQNESASEVVFSFYNGELFRIEVNYDRYEIEGLTTDDVVDAISNIYGPAAKAAVAAALPEDRYADRDEVVARWQDPQYSFELVRSSYGPTFKLIGVLKRLDSPAQAAIQEAKRLDTQEAPQREAARQASEQEAARAKLENVRLVNKPRFRP